MLPPVCRTTGSSTPTGPRIEERVLGDDGYRLVGTFGPGEVFRPTIFPGLEIPLDEIAG